VASGFVSKIVSDPSKVPGVMLLTGYMGDAAQEDRRRLYVTPDLSQWIDIPADSVLHVAQMPGPENWLEAVMVWVKQDAQLVPGNRWYSAPGR
jgi:hypothetical protein